MHTRFREIQEEEQRETCISNNSLIINFFDNYESFWYRGDLNNSDQMILLDDMRRKFDDKVDGVNFFTDTSAVPIDECSAIQYDWSLFNAEQKKVAQNCVCCVNLAPTLVLIPLICAKCTQIICGASRCHLGGCPYCRMSTNLVRVPFIHQLLNELPVSCGNCGVVCSREELIKDHLCRSCPFYTCNLCGENYIQNKAAHRIECKYTGLNNKTLIAEILSSIFAFFTSVDDEVARMKIANHVVLAGGSVLRRILKDCDLLFQHSYDQSDYDLFIHGVDNAQEANQIVNSIIQSINLRLCIYKYVISDYAITIYCKYQKKIQIILRLYRNVSEILAGFDIDCCCVATNGKTVWATPRSQYAINYRCNTVDINKRSTTYESRLWKYSRRGFSVQVPRMYSYKDNVEEHKDIVSDICMDTKSTGLKLLLRAHFIQRMSRGGKPMALLNMIFGGKEEDYIVSGKNYKCFFPDLNHEINVENIRWVVNNAGTQGKIISGSFQPLDPSTWFNGLL